MEQDLKYVTFEGKDYIVLDEIKDNDTTYFYLSNENDENDFFINKLQDDKLIELEDEEEFNKALKIFKEKNMNDLI